LRRPDPRRRRSIELLDKVTTDLGLIPGNTRLVIQRVNVMKLIFQAQTEIDRLRARG
jgi:hypothetical protein